MPSLVRQPKQQRSRATMERFYAAAERLLAEQPVERVTVPAIAKAARSSVGAFYKRFADKDAFLVAFYDTFFSRIRAVARDQLDATRWAGKPARALIDGFVRTRLEHYRQYRALLANLFLHLRSVGDERFVQHAQSFGDELTATLAELLSSGRADLPQPPPPSRVRTIIGIGAAALRERILYGRARNRSDATDQAYAETVARMMWLELSTPDGRAGE